MIVLILITKTNTLLKSIPLISIIIPLPLLHPHPLLSLLLLFLLRLLLLLVLLLLLPHLVLLLQLQPKLINHVIVKRVNVLNYIVNVLLDKKYVWDVIVLDVLIQQNLKRKERRL